MSNPHIRRRDFLINATMTGAAAAVGASCQEPAGNSKPIIASSASAAAGAAYPWLWDRPRPPVHTPIFHHPPQSESVRTTAVPAVHLLPDGRIEVDFSYDIPVSGAVQLDKKRPIYVSSDGGRTFTFAQEPPAELVFGDSEKVSIPTTPIRLPNGVWLICGTFGWESFPPSRRKEFEQQGYYVFGDAEGNTNSVISISYRAWQKASYDDGKTWEFHQIDLPTKFSQLNFYNQEGYSLSDGTFVRAGYGGLMTNGKPGDCTFLLATRDARKWDVYKIADADQHGFCEPALTQAANGDVVVLMRTGGQRELWTTISSDGGKTWAEPWDSGLRGSTPWLVTNGDGVLVAVFGRRGISTFPRTGIWCGVSRDHGRTWKQSLLVDRGAELVPANGMAVPLPDGSVYAVYAYLNGVGIGGSRFHPDFG